jgi:hypothetical protein
LSDFSVDERKR